MLYSKIAVLYTANMKLIVGLGNPGKKYTCTRHNIGFRVVDQLTSMCTIDSEKEKFNSLIYQGIIANCKVMLVKPQTFMNLSGSAIKQIASFYKISNLQILVMYDDFEIPFGTIRIKEKGSAGTHNGLKSILETMQSTNITRIRIGITPPPNKNVISQHVLSNFTVDEESKLEPIITASANSAIEWVKDNTQFAMQEYNNKQLLS
ncbi:aminoacyl-tRNA hydrolase [Candidatus Marinamargulisbacteria bacterium SCGC AG-414-C22]|nr:aminoacyl-tRNA hydrolase [Candidatus Marinamargulisbacteria bacterium SCGC AG-414-C22]